MLDPVTAQAAVNLIKKLYPQLEEAIRRGMESTENYAEMLELQKADDIALSMHISITDAELRAMKRLVDALETSLSSLTEDVGANTDDIGDLKQDVKELQEAEPERPLPTERALIWLSAEVDAQVRDLRSQVATLNAQVAALQG